MLVLLVLFPIIMLELKFLSPLLAGLNSSLATFIGNAISVTLLSWPLMPLVIYLLQWWLNPRSSRRQLINWLGGTLIICLYLVEIMLLWNLLP